MQLKERTPDDIRSLFVNVSGSRNRITWEEVANECERFYYNEQLDDQQKSRLKSMDLEDLIINEITPHTKLMLYFLTGSLPKFRAVGMDGFDSKKAQMHETIALHDWKKSKASTELYLCSRESLVRGKGYMYVDVDTNAFRGEGVVTFKMVSSRFVYVSEGSRDVFERDARWKLIKENTTRETLINQYPDHAAKIRAAKPMAQYEFTANKNENSYIDSFLIRDGDQYDAYSTDATELDIIDVYQLFEKYTIKYHKLIHKVILPPKTLDMLVSDIVAKADLMIKEHMVKLKESSLELRNALEAGQIIQERFDIEIDKLKLQTDEAVTQIKNQKDKRINEIKNQTKTIYISDDELKAVKKKYKIKEKDILADSEYFEHRIKKTLCIGDQKLYSVTLPFIEDYNLIPLPYEFTGSAYSLSYIYFLLGKQREINAFHQIMIKHAENAASPKTILVKGMVDDLDTFEDDFARSSAAVEINDDGSQRQPQIVYPQALNNAFYTMAGEAKLDMEHAAGSRGIQSGGTTNAPDSYRGLVKADEYATRRIRTYINNIFDEFLVELGNIHKQVAQGMYTTNRVFTVAVPDANGAMKEFQAEINIPLFDDVGKEVGLYNDYNTMEFDVVIIPGSTMPISRHYMIEMMVDLYEKNIVDDVAVLKESDVPDKQSILRRKAMVIRQAQQIEGMDEEIKKGKETIAALERQIRQALTQVDVQKSLKALEKEFAKTEFAQALLRKTKEIKSQAGLEKLNDALDEAIARVGDDGDKNPVSTNKS